MPYGAVRRARFVRSVHDAGRSIEGGPMDKATFNCPHCGGLYGITLGRRPAFLLAGCATCEVCGREMIRWSTPSRPAFHLIERPEDRVSTTRMCPILERETPGHRETAGRG